MKTQSQLSEARCEPAGVSGCKEASRLEVTFGESGCFLLDISILPPLPPRLPRRITPRPSLLFARYFATPIRASDGADRFLCGPGEAPPPPLP